MTALFDLKDTASARDYLNICDRIYCFDGLPVGT